jgi:hypothetical protein
MAHPTPPGGGRGGRHSFMNRRFPTALGQHPKEVSIQFMSVNQTTISIDVKNHFESAPNDLLIHIIG